MSEIVREDEEEEEDDDEEEDVEGGGEGSLLCRFFFGSMFEILIRIIILQGDSQITMEPTFHHHPIWRLRPNSVFELFRISQIFLSKE